MEILTLDRLEEKEMAQAAELYIKSWGDELLKKENNIRSCERLDAEILSQLRSRREVFPQGQIVAWDKRKKVVGMINGLKRYSENHREMPYNPELNQWLRLTDWGYFGSHEAAGNTLFCVSICTSESQVGGKKVSRELIGSAAELAESDGLGMFAYSRPFRFRQSGKRKIWNYLEDVRKGKIRDPVGMHMYYSGSGISDLIIIPNGRPDDRESRGYIVAIPYRNGLIPRK